MLARLEQLSEMRYRADYQSPAVLTNETNYFDAQLGIAQAQLNELAGLVGISCNRQQPTVRIPGRTFLRLDGIIGTM